jgi:predicted Zn-dependent protease
MEGRLIMYAINKCKLISLLSFFVFLSGCTEVDITGRKQLNLVPNSTMNSMSFQNYSEFLSQNKLSTNVQQTQMVKRVGTRIQNAVEKYCNEKGIQDRLSGYEWEFNLVEDPNVNAWCMPGGKVVVYTGLLPVAQNETGLAVVMGHEIAHAFARHGAERMTQGLLVEMGGIALSKALQNRPEQTKNLFMTSYGVGSQVGVLLPYSRVHESEADHLGLVFMAMAGYNPQEAVTFWQRMSAANQSSQPLELLSTHPADTTRIRDIQKLLPEAMTYYKQQ